MATRNRVIISMVVLALALVGCTGVYIPQRVEAVTTNMVEQTVRFWDEGEVGRQYTFNVTVPDEWVGQGGDAVFEVRNDGSKVTFNHITESGRRAPIFDIQALSRQQYWEQNGSYPQSYKAIKSAVGDTYFIYYTPAEAFYSGLSEEVYESFTQQIPGIIQTFAVMETNNTMMGEGNF